MTIGHAAQDKLVMQNAEKFVCLLDTSMLTSAMGTSKPLAVEVRMMLDIILSVLHNNVKLKVVLI